MPLRTQHPRLAARGSANVPTTRTAHKATTLSTLHTQALSRARQYPQIANVNGYFGGIDGAQGENHYSRFSLCFARGNFGALGVRIMKERNPGIVVLVYIDSLNADFTQYISTGFQQAWTGGPTFTVPTPWLAGRVGTTLGAAVTTTTTGTWTLAVGGGAVIDPSGDNSYRGTYIVDSGTTTPEIVTGTVVADTLVVTARGQYGSTAQTHLISARISQLPATYIGALTSTTVSAAGAAASGNIPLFTGGGSVLTPTTSTFAGSYIIDYNAAAMEIVTGSISGDSIVVTARGQNGTTAQTHASGARVAQLANWYSSHRPLYNPTVICPVVNGQTWAQAFAQYVTMVVNYLGVDGVFLDNCTRQMCLRASGTNIGSQALDASYNNVGDGGEGNIVSGVTGTRWWADGKLDMMRLIRQALGPTKIVISNDCYYPPHADGRELESFDGHTTTAFGNAATTDAGQNVNKQFQANWAYYMRTVDPARTDHGHTAWSPTVMNPDSQTWPTDFTAAAVLTRMRFNLAACLQSNAHFCFDGLGHGVTWMFDEYIKGQGSALSATITTGTSIGVVDASRFAVGDLVHIPYTGSDASNPLGDEVVSVTAVNTGTNTLTATRAVQGGTASTQVKGTLVFTDAHLRAGMGWLGQPLGPSQNVGVAQTAISTALVHGAFDTAGTPPAGWSFAANGGTSATATQITTDGPPGVSTCCQVTLTSIQPTTAGAGPNTIELYQNPNSTAFPYAASTTYTLTWWAKSDTDGFDLFCDVTQSSAPSTTHSQHTPLSTDWRQYRMSFTITTAELSGYVGGYYIRFGLNYCVGTVYLGNVTLTSAPSGHAPELYVRYFEHGAALLNATPTAQTIALDGRGYSRIKGSQDATTNSGASVGNSVSVPTFDGLLLSTP